MTSPIDAHTVKSFAPFAELTFGEATAVAQLLEFQSLARDEILFREGDASDAIYLIISGEIDIFIKVPSHADHKLVTLSPGAIFGEVSPLADEHRTATTIARTEVSLARLARIKLEYGLENGDRWASKFIFSTAQILARRLTAVNSQLAATLARIDNKPDSSAPKSEDELDALRRRLLQDWSF